MNNNVRLFHKVLVLIQRKLVFFGEPAEALSHVNAKSFKELYDKLEEPVAEQLRHLASDNGTDPTQDEERKLRLAQVKEGVAESWKQR